MKQLLLVAYWVPPRTGIGTIRAAHLIKHLPAYGWEPTVLTPGFAKGGQNGFTSSYVTTGYFDVKSAVKRLIGISGRGTHAALNVPIPAYGTKRTPLQRLISLGDKLVAYPDEHVGWVPFAATAIKNACVSRTWNAILSSAPPMTTNLAVALARPRIPWIADLRDLWADDDTQERSPARVFLDDRLERASLSRAAALVATSELSAQRLRGRYPDKFVTSIDTGFDPGEWDAVNFGREDRCTLLYAGILYRGKRDPGLLFAALRELLHAGTVHPQDLRVNFYCARDQWLLDMIGQYELQEVVQVHGFIERAKVLAAERRADRLILLSWDGHAMDGVVPGKLFEYFGARRRIMALGGSPGRTSVADLLQSTGAGLRCLTKEEVKDELLRALHEHRADICVIPAQAISMYTAGNCAMRFAQLLDSAAGERGGLPAAGTPA